MENKIIIKGARVHNLKNINLELPKNKIIVFTGVSGSGKSSLAFDTIFAEGQRRYIESLSPYARQFLGQMKRADVDEIIGLCPSIAINQKALSHNPRSTVGTLTEIYDYLRVLFARLGEVYCPKCGSKIEKLTLEEIVDIILEKAVNYSFSVIPAKPALDTDRVAGIQNLNSTVTVDSRLRGNDNPRFQKDKKDKQPTITILSPVVRGRKGEYYQLFYDFLNLGFSQARIDKRFHSLHERIVLSRYRQHTIEIVIDKLLPQEQNRLFEAVETALGHSRGLVTVIFNEGQTNQKEMLLSAKRSCPKDNFSFPEIEPRLFSFNSPYGACQTCSGLGKIDLFLKTICPECLGKRLRPEALAVRINGKNIAEISNLPIDKAAQFFKDYERQLNPRQKAIAANVLKEIKDCLHFLNEVGLNYLSLDREAETLSGGEAQRIRLASQIGTHLSNTLYVLDEPTIGLHDRDTGRLIKTLKSLRDQNNTVIVVEHDEQTIKKSDYLIDLGPMAGKAGGEVITSGQTEFLLKSSPPKGRGGEMSLSLTLDYLRGHKKISVPQKRRLRKTEGLKIIGARANNLKNLTVEIPLRKLICITGVSGSGKSSLIVDTLYKNLSRIKSGFKDEIKDVSRILGSEYLERVVVMDQSPIGRTPRSNPATYTGIFTPIREFYAQLPISRERAYSVSRFSFNVKGGRCEACQGAGANLIEMHFLPPVLVECEVCQGKRFSRETLEIEYKKKNISQVLQMTVDEALKFFKNIYYIADKLKVLQEVGLGYLQLGQNATTLSGGEAQRIKLARELTQSLRSMAKRTLYLLDEPTVGLHYHDIEMLLKVLNKLVDRNNTVVVIEHNMHIIKSVDYIIDLGPEGGEAGGQLVGCGTPEQITEKSDSITGKYLKKFLH